MSTTIKLRRDTAANWGSVNPTLNAGEIGFETDTGRLKIGDGATAWTGLGYGPIIGPAALAGDVARRNFLTNPGLDIWQAGAGPFNVPLAYGPDGWYLNFSAPDTLYVGQEAVNVDAGSSSAAVLGFVKNDTNGYFQQRLEDFERLRGRTVAFSARVKCSTADAVLVSVYDSVNGWRNGVAAHSGSGDYETLSVVAAIDPAATAVEVAIAFVATCTAYVDNSVLALGTVPVDYEPLPSAEDMARCQRYREVLGDGVVYEQYGMGMTVSETEAVFVIPFKVRKGGVPTVTLSAAASFLIDNSGSGANLSTIAASIPTPTSMRITATTPGGLTVGRSVMLEDGGAGTSRILVEYHP